jgi:glutamine---fructose-6-phosphate transaminase (isomerizing)
VATLERGELARRRAEGKLRNLEARLAREPLEGMVGIGHTRCATHGRLLMTAVLPRPMRIRMPPIASWSCTMASSRIFRELREELEHKGARFGSETDTEVVAHLVTQEMNNGHSPAEAVAAAAARRIRVRFPVRRRGRPSHRGPQRLATVEPNLPVPCPPTQVVVCRSAY